MKNIVTATFQPGYTTAKVLGLWQYDYGQILRIQGLELPDTIEIHFSLQEKGGESERQVGVTRDGVTEVSIPNSYLENAGTSRDYSIYAFLYISDGKSGNTEYKITMHVQSRPKPKDPETPEDPKKDPFGETVEVVNKAMESARASAEAAAESEKSASESAARAEKSAVESQKSAESAAESEKAAATSATAAAESASQARESATVACSAADQAGKSATAAAESRNAVAQLAENATQSAQNASSSAESAARSAEVAKTAADTAGKSASSAQQAAGSAAESASTATAAANSATTAAGKAAESATSADRSAETAGQKATAAETAASNAEKSATEAEKSATAAGDSASAAKASETAAEEAAQTAQEQAEEIKDSAEQIEKNKAGVAAIIIEESATGSNIVITDSAKMPLRGLKLFGKSTQVTTTGKNLIDFPDIITSQAKYPVTITDPNALKSANALPRNVQLCVSGIYSSDSTENTHKWMWFYIGNNVAGKFEINGPSSVIPEGDIISIYVYFGTGAKNVSLTKVQVEEGTAATSYEPYTDGKPSPSPDFPQEIVSAGDSGNIEVDVTGKNLVDIQSVETYWAHTLSVSVDELNKHVGDTVTVTGTFDVISVKSDKTSNRYEFRVSARNEDGSYTAYASKTLNTAPKIGDKIIVSKTVTVSKKIKSILLYGFGVDNIGTLGTSKATVQIELGGVATPYKPFEKETLNLITPTGLPGIPVDSDGNYTDENGQQWVCDEVDFERGVYVQRIGIADQDSFSTIIWTTGAICFVNLKANTLQTRYAMTTISAVYRPTWVPSSYATHFTQTISQKLIIVLPNTITTKEQGEEIRQKGFKFAYILGKPIETPLSPEEIAAYKALTTHKTTTLISNDAGAGMEVSYVADPKTYIDNKFAELSQALIASASEAE